jgi:RNA polymerase sigma factor (sigma-70 family)
MDYRWHVPERDESARWSADNSPPDRWFEWQREQWDKVDEHLPENLRLRREELGWSQEELAQMMSRLGFAWHQSTVYKIESGVRRVSLREGMALTSVLQTTTFSLIGAPAHSREMREFQRAVNDARHKWLGLLEIVQRYLLAHEVLKPRLEVIEELIRDGQIDPDGLTVEALEDIAAARSLVASTPEQAIDRGRSYKLKDISNLPIGMTKPPTKDRADDERTTYRSEREHDAVRAAMENMSTNERAVWRLISEKDLPNREIAQELGISEGWVRQYVTSGLKKLRTELEES